MAYGPSILFGSRAGHGPKAPRVREPRLRPWTDTHRAVAATLRADYGYTTAAVSMAMVTHFDFIEAHAGNGMTDEAIADHVYRTEFRCGRGRS